MFSWHSAIAFWSGRAQSSRQRLQSKLSSDPLHPKSSFTSYYQFRSSLAMNSNELVEKPFPRGKTQPARSIVASCSLFFHVDFYGSKLSQQSALLKLYSRVLLPFYAHSHPYRWIFSMLCNIIINFHCPSILFFPRKLNRLIPIASVTLPNTGSTAPSRWL